MRAASPWINQPHTLLFGVQPSTSALCCIPPANVHCEKKLTLPGGTPSPSSSGMRLEPSMVD